MEKPDTQYLSQVIKTNISSAKSDWQNVPWYNDSEYIEVIKMTLCFCGFPSKNM